MQVELSPSGITCKGILNRKHIGWNQIFSCREEDNSLKIFYEAPERRATVELLEMGVGEARSVISNDAFPRWLLSSKAAEKLGGSQINSAAFGPPQTTQWIRGETSPEREAWRTVVSRTVKAFEFLGVTQVGVFANGVAFDTKRFGVEILATTAIAASHTPPLENRYWFGALNVDAPASTAYVVTRNQAREILAQRSRDSWGLPESVWKDLG